MPPASGGLHGSGRIRRQRAARLVIRNLVLVGSLGLAWGLNWPAVRLALNEILPLTFRATGFSIAAIIMFGVILAIGASPTIPRRHWGRLLVVGVLTIVGYNVLSAFAQLTASTSRSAVLSYTMPIWAVLLARVVLGEMFDARRTLGLALGAAGLLALGWPLVVSGQFSRGLVFALLSGVVWAAGSVVLKRWPIDAIPLVIAAWQIALSAILMAGAALAFEGVPQHVPKHLSTWLGLGYNIVIGQAIATTLWFVILTRMPAGVAAIGSLLVPAIGVVSATLILGERPTLSDWLGLSLIVAASATVLLRGRGRERDAPVPPQASTDPLSSSATFEAANHLR